MKDTNIASELQRLESESTKTHSENIGAGSQIQMNSKIPPYTDLYPMLGQEKPIHSFQVYVASWDAVLFAFFLFFLLCMSVL